MTKGIILAGGNGTRLFPLTKAVSKHLLPVYDKPMIYYSLSVLMLAKIKDVLIIARPEDLVQYQRLLQDGSVWGMNIEYAEQQEPNGIPEAFILGEEFIGSDSVCLILGDNLFHGHRLSELLSNAKNDLDGAMIFAYKVKDPKRFGIVELDNDLNVKSIEEKPEKPKSSYAVTGLYYYDNEVVKLAKTLTPSARGELEITDLNNLYLKKGKLKAQLLSRGFSWLDAGTYTSLIEANQFVQTIENRQGLKIACLEEIAFNNKWVSIEQLKDIYTGLAENEYRVYLQSIYEEAIA